MFGAKNGHGKFVYLIGTRNITRKSNLPPSSKVNKFIWQFLGANLTDFSQIEVEIKPNYPSEVHRTSF